MITYCLLTILLIHKEFFSKVIDIISFDLNLHKIGDKKKTDGSTKKLFQPRFKFVGAVDFFFLRE